MSTTPDPISSPAHYQQAPHGIPGQPFDYFGYMDGFRATAFRYVWRCGFKDDTEGDIHKALTCIKRDITHGNGKVTDKPGHLTHQLANGPTTLRRKILLDIWNRHDLTNTHALLVTTLNDPTKLDEEI
jgi:hypothetical protein